MKKWKLSFGYLSWIVVTPTLLTNRSPPTIVVYLKTTGVGIQTTWQSNWSDSYKVLPMEYEGKTERKRIFIKVTSIRNRCNCVWRRRWDMSNLEMSSKEHYVLLEYENKNKNWIHSKWDIAQQNVRFIFAQLDFANIYIIGYVKHN